MKVYAFRENWFIFGIVRPLPQTTIERIKQKAIEQSKVHRIRIHDLRYSHTR